MGIRQSGALSFKNFDVYRDADIAQKALTAVDDILSGRLRLTKAEEEILREKSSLASGTILL